IFLYFKLYMYTFIFIYFFFSSRRRHTRFSRDWSSTCALPILARDAGFELEPSDVELGAILPQACLEATSVDDFYTELLKADQYFNGLKAQAQAENKVIRYIGKLEEGKVSIALEMVDETHPFYSLSGSDNIISFTTERYKERPLVVKGPGAGAEVTAGGVFADLVNVGA